jgi:hypothetical protein
MLERGLTWYELQELYADKLRTPLSIAFAFVATHNHFVLDRGGKVFNRSAPIIKLPEGATEEDHLALLGYLNSSTACFWMKQVVHRKSSASQKHHADPARAAYEFAGTALEQMPIPVLSSTLLAIVRELLEIGERRAAWLDGALLRGALASCEPAGPAAVGKLLEEGWNAYDRLRDRAVFLQEELDWWSYAAFGLCPWEDANVVFEEGQTAPPGARPFELETGYDAGFSHRVRSSGAVAIAREKVPARWVARVSLLEREGIRNIESREFKRQWRDTEDNVDPVEFRRELGRRHLTAYVVDAIEGLVRDRAAVIHGRFLTRALLDSARGRLVQAIAEYLQVEVPVLVNDLVASQAIPFFSAYRFTDDAMSGAYAAWQHTWGLQRREDAGEKDLKIPVPPKYDQKDYRDSIYWRLRGKLDVPKERFISYPGAERDDDRSPLIGWAGWDHLQRAQALATLYQERKNQDGWEKERLQPLLAGLLELVPWLKQWHNALDDDPAKDRAGDAYATFVDTEARALGFTLDDLRAWRPEEKKGRKNGKARAAAPANGAPDKQLAMPLSLEDAAPTPAKKPRRKSKKAKAEEAAE